MGQVSTGQVALARLSMGWDDGGGEKRWRRDIVWSRSAILSTVTKQCQPVGISQPQSSGDYQAGGVGLDSTGLHMELWSPAGLQVDSRWTLDYNLAGLPAKENPHGLHVDSMSPCGVQWSPPGIYGAG